jgi:putative transposase
MLGAVEKRLGNELLEKSIQWLMDDCSAYAAHETRWFTRELNLKPCATAMSRPKTNSIAEQFVKTIKSN